MKYSKWIGVGAVVLVYVAAFMPWIEVPSQHIVVTGMHTEGTNFGKPAMMNLIISTFSLIFFLWPAIFAKRVNLFFTAFNVAWTLRNSIILSTCRAGECPEKKLGLYLMGFAAALMLFASFFPNVKLAEPETVVPED
ncbi:MAG: hypothetical protein ABI151_09565 [Chitinophagaceae bacterium]